MCTLLVDKNLYDNCFHFYVVLVFFSILSLIKGNVQNKDTQHILIYNFVSKLYHITVHKIH